MTDNRLVADHSRRFQHNRFVYPVWSRRSHGLSIGINLNPDKVCNFDCIYCQVDRTSESETPFVDWRGLLSELDEMFLFVTSGRVWRASEYSAVPESERRLNDIAFSGDGEPTTYRNFDEIIAACAERKSHFGLSEVKMVLITNASMFHRPHVERGLEILDRNQGEIWAKLDAGTAAYYEFIERTKVPFQRVLDNITAAAQRRPLVIQSLFMHVNSEPPSTTELDEYCERLNEIQAAGGLIRLVQIYTIARRPAESYVSALSNESVDAIVQRVRERTKMDARPYYGVSTE